MDGNYRLTLVHYFKRFMNIKTNSIYLSNFKLIHISWYHFRPDASSLTAQRARDGEAKLRQEVCDLCDVIFNLGTASSDGKAKIQFGELSQVSNWKINI